MSDSSPAKTGQSPGATEKSGGVAVATPKRKTKPAGKSKPAPLPAYHVVLLDDDDHSYEYVIEMLGVLFGHPTHEGYRLAEQVDKAGRAIVLTTHREKAELKRDQIHAYGRDQAVATCVGSMSAIIEPAQE